MCCVCLQRLAWSLAHSWRSANGKEEGESGGTPLARPQSKWEALGKKGPECEGAGGGVKGLSQGRLAGMRLQAHAIFSCKSCNFMLQGTTE